MANTTVKGKFNVVAENGDVRTIYPKTTGDQVLVDRSSNASVIPNDVANLQHIVNKMGSLALKSKVETSDFTTGTMISSLEGLKSNTDTGKIADATVVKAIESRVDTLENSNLVTVDELDAGLATKPDTEINDSVTSTSLTWSSKKLSDQLTELNSNSQLLNNNIRELVPTETTKWLNENISPVGNSVVIDKTLSIDGTSADAKITGDRLNEINDNLINDVYPITGVEDLLTFTNMSGKDTNIYLHANTTYIIKNITPLDYSTASGPLSIKGYENEYYISCPVRNGTIEFTPLHDGYLHMYNGDANATGLKLRVIGKIDDIEKQLNDLSTVKDDIFLIQSDIDRKGSNYIHGTFYNTGNIYYPSNGISCITDFISTFPGLIVSSYGVPGVIHSCVFYDKNKNKISNLYQYQPSFSGIVTPENAYYVRVQITESQFNNIEIRVNPYTLKASSSSQIRTCLDRNYISQRIIVANGTYNLYDTFTENEINNAVYNNTEWCGIDIKNNTVLEGESREGTIITCEIPKSFSISNRDAISTFNIKGNCTLKNLTIKSKNIRYPIHDDFKQSVNTIHKLINCNFIAGPNATGSNGYKTNGYGLGSRSGETIIFNNCYIEPYMIYHNNTGFDVGSSVIMNNCEVSEKINVWDANCPVQCKFELNNVKCGCLAHTYDTSHNNQTIEIIGTGSSPDFIYAQSNTIYNLGNCRKVQVHWGGNQGMLVCSHYGDNNIKFGTVRTTDKSNTAIGILLNDTAEDDFGIIQCSGYISANKLGNTDITNWQTGTMLTVGSNRYLTPTLDKSECIAYVAIIIDNVMYIKLCLK